MDNKDGDLTSSITNDAPSEFAVGDTVITFSVSDAVGNTVTGSSTITVVVLDADGNGVNDAEEGYGDVDGDGIPDYADPIYDNGT